jgi:hypothetical protein
MSEYDSLVSEFKLSNNQIFNLLDRMENYKMLLNNNNSVFHTLRIWHKTDLNRSNKSLINKNLGQPEYMQKQIKLNEGPTIGNR